MASSSNNVLNFTFECEGGAEFKVVKFDFDEGLSTPFSGTINLASSNANIRAEEIVDKTATLKLFRNGTLERSYSGIVQAFRVEDTGKDFTFYTVILVPALARLSLRQNSRIFQKQTVVKIVETLLSEMNITDYALALRNPHEEREYCVQYRESDLEFMHRLLAEEGIFYYFEFNDNKHTLILADQSSVVDVLEGSFPYNVMAGGTSPTPYVRQFSARFKIAPTDVVMMDYSFKSPSFDFRNETYGQSMDYQGNYEHFDYPGRYKNQDIGKGFAQTRIDYLRRDSQTGLGLSDMANIISGFKLPLSEHSNSAFNQEWLVTHVHHEGEQPQSLEHQGIDGMTRYSNEFSCIPGKLQWKPTPEPKPVINGFHSARVVGPKNEEIYVDEYGRVKVQFPWDREGKNDENSSCWIRVSDGWAGSSMGVIAIPRIGTELVICFLESDPDQPHIHGALYNATKRQPYKLPEHKTITGIKTKTHKGEGYNELYFDDATGAELINIHAQKDVNTKVNNVKNERVDFDRISSIGNNESLVVAKDRIITVEGDQHHKTTGNYKALVEEKSSLEVKGDYKEHIEGAKGIKVTGEIVLESKTKFTAKTGSSFVVIDSGGVYVDGGVVLINAGGSPGNTAAPVNPDALIAAAGLGSMFIPNALIPPIKKEESVESKDDTCIIDAETGLPSCMAKGDATTQATNNPIHAATGAKLLSGASEVDFNLAGLLNLHWQRHYSSLNKRIGVLGQGWSLPFELGFRVEHSVDGTHDAILIDHDGRAIHFGTVVEGESVFAANEGYYIYHINAQKWGVETIFGDYFTFTLKHYQDNKQVSTFNLSKIADQHLNTLVFHYDKTDKVIKIDNHDRSILVYLEYHPLSGRLLSVTQENSINEQRVLVTYHYNKDNQLVEVLRGGELLSRRFAYNEYNLMTMHEDANGLRSLYEWKSFDNINYKGEAVKEWRVITQKVVDDKGKCYEAYTLDYDLLNRTLHVHQENIGTKIHKWNIHFLITEYTDVQGSTWLQYWNGKKQLVQKTDPHNASTYYRYNERGNLIEKINPLGEETRYTWHNRFAFPLMVRNEAGHEWHSKYDEKGNLVEQIDPKRGVTQYQYNEQGLLVQSTNAKGRITTQSWNHYGQLIESRDCSEKVTQIHYDSWQNIKCVTDATGAATQYAIDPLGRLLSMTLADGRQQFYQYDEALKITYVRDFAKRTYHYHYNARGQVVSQKNAKGDSVHFDYDPLGRLSTLCNENNERYTFEYDSLHRLTSQIDISGIKTDYHYNILGQLINYQQHAEVGSTLPSITHSFKYDVLGRIVEKQNHEDMITYGYQHEQSVIKRFTKEAWQQALATHIEPEAYDELRFNYDELGLLVEEHNHAGQFRHNYDPIGNILETQFPDGRRLSHLYYGSGHLLQTNLEEGGQNLEDNYRHVLAEYERDDLHREVVRSQGSLQHTTQYDVMGRINLKRAHTTGITDAFAPIINKTFNYDTADNLTHRAINYGKDNSELHGIMRTTEYHYDPLGQITARLGEAEHELYHYDKAANLLAEQSQTKNIRQNRLLTHGALNYTYDGFGRMLTREGHKTHEKQRFIYDSEHRLTKVELLNHPTIKAVDYRYDVIGRRTQKVIYYLQATTPAKTTDFWWNGMQMCAEVESNRSCLYVYNDQSYEPLARIERHNGDQSTDKVSYFHNHINGAPEEMTNKDGEIIWYARLNLFGKTQKEHLNTEYQTEQNLRFQGQYLDRETGLHYNTFRYYDPEIGRFTQQDPIGLEGGANLYQYAPNTQTWIDPFGLQGHPAPSPNIPGGPWERSTGQGQRPGTFYGTRPAGQSGPRPQCNYVPPEGQGGPPGSRGYHKASIPGQKGWQRYDLKGNPITPEEAHPKPRPKPPPPPPASFWSRLAPFARIGGVVILALWPSEISPCGSLDYYRDHPDECGPKK